MNKPMGELEHNIVWAQVATVSDFPEDGGMCVQVEDQQIAIFNFEIQKVMMMKVL